MSPNHPNHLSPEDHLRAQIDRLRVQLTGTGGGAWRNVLADCANALAECIGRDDPRWKVVERANRLLDDRTESTTQSVAAVPGDEAEMGLVWWNGLTKHERSLWLRKAGSAAPIEAWRTFRAGGTIHE